MKIQIEIPDGWLDEKKLGNLDFIVKTCRQEMQRILMDAFTKKIFKQMKTPKITITEKELKKAVLDKMVEKAIVNI